MKILTTIILMVTLSAFADLSPKVSKAEFYKLNNAAFEKQMMRQHKFRWNDQSKTSARSFRASSFLNMKVTEAIVEFGAPGIKKVSLYLYNRGDDGNIKQQAFNDKVNEVRKALATFTKAQERKQTKTGATKANSSYWLKSNVLYRLTYNGGPISKRGPWQSEFIRLDLNFNEGNFVNSATRLRSAAHVRKNVQNKDNGDVVIANVPMVDQGQKGYCACATTARVLQYFGRNVDQHEIAQLALSTAGGGTNPDQLLNSLKKIRTKFNLNVSELIHLDMRMIKKLARYYDKLAKKQNKPPMNLRYGYMAAFSGDRQLMLEARSQMSDYDRFIKHVKNYVRQGVPLSWTLIVGIYKENKRIPQAGGGHMRLIIGYNEKTEEIIFTDSWGRGHEVKRMGMKEAWAASTGLYLVKPR